MAALGLGNPLGNPLARPRSTAVAAAAAAKSSLVKLQAVGGDISYSYTGILQASSQLISYEFGKGVLTGNSNTPDNKFSLGLTYNASGMVGWATKSTGDTLNRDALIPFAGGVICQSDTTGLYLKATTNGSTTTESTFVSIPASGTLDDTSAYSGLSKLRGVLGSSPERTSCCVSHENNLIILHRATVSGADRLLAFIIDSAGTIVGRKNLGAPVSGSFLGGGFFEIRKSGTGYIIAAIYNDVGLSTLSMAIGNLTSSFVFSLLFNGSTGVATTSPPGRVMMLNSTAVMIVCTTSLADGYGSYAVAANLNASGAAILPGTTIPRSLDSNFSLNPIPRYNDVANGMLISTSNAGVAVAGNPVWSRVYSSDSIIDTTDGISFYLKVLAVVPVLEGVKSLSNALLSYLGEGYWAVVWNNQTDFLLKARLLKEV